MTKSFDSTLMFFCQPGVVSWDILFLGDWRKKHILWRKKHIFRMLVFYWAHSRRVFSCIMVLCAEKLTTEDRLKGNQLGYFLTEIALALGVVYGKK